MTEFPKTAAPAVKKAHSGLIASVIGLILALSVVQLFVTFRGLATPSAMDQAQIARSLARGDGLQTQVVRPYAWQLMLENKINAPAIGQQDSAQPPLPSLLMAPVFKMLESRWDYSGETSIYLLDRVVAAISLLLFWSSIGITFLTAERLFDQQIGVWTVFTIAVCQLLWNIALSGLAPMLLLFLFSITLFLIALLIERDIDNRSDQWFLAIAIGLLATAMVFTHWMALWIVLGLVVTMAIILRRRSLSLLVLLPVLIALTLWGTRNVEISGDILGTAKGTLQGILIGVDGEKALREFSVAAPMFDLGALGRLTFHQAAAQLSRLYLYLGASFPAALFFLTLLHPFKRRETHTMRWALVLIWFAAFAGMSITGLPDEEKDERQLHFIFLPLFSAYGLAFLIVLWTRLKFTASQHWWSRHGAPTLAIALSALPLLSSLPETISLSLRLRGYLNQWPPYLPDRFASLKPMVSEREILVSDVPWAIAWYADRTCVWLPANLDQFEKIRSLSASQNTPVAGIVFTPWSAKAESVSSVLKNQYLPWANLIYRATAASLGADIMAQSTFPYKEFLPLAGQPMPQGRFIADMVFMSDRPRWNQPKPTQ